MRLAWFAGVMKVPNPFDDKVIGTKVAVSVRTSVGRNYHPWGKTLVWDRIR